MSSSTATIPTGRSAGTRVEAVVDLAAVGANLRVLLDLMRASNPAGELMAVVKADAYGHGAVPVARAALAAGVTRLGVATPGEAVALRAAGITAPVLAWLWPPDEPIGEALARDVELGVSGRPQLDAVLAQAGGRVPAVHVKVDTGLGRSGVGPLDVPAVLDAVAAAERAGRIRVTGLMSHLASADVPGDPSVAEQVERFRAVIAAAAARGIDPPVRHLANTAGLVDHPDSRFDLARVGIGGYGLNPVATPVPLRPAMTLRATVALTKRVPAGQGVSYGLTYRTATETTLALIPLGYADGIPRAASNRGEILVAGRRRRIAGRVAMDQVVVDCGDDRVTAGDPAIVFGPGDDGEPTARDWAGYCDTIDYEIVTRIGPRVPRRHVGGTPS
ncbi:alanine racemase [Nakamurella sp.]|uniref:alanine racemase n=1 Tax=Nakamurella sp. TaxID=1869182 RepID=UPI003B3AFB99